MPNLYVNECGSECEIVHQSKIRFECQIECQCNECGIKCKIESKIEYKAQNVTKCVIESQIPNVKVKVLLLCSVKHSSSPA